MILLAGADLILPDRVLEGAALLLSGDRIVEIVAHGTLPAADLELDLRGYLVVPGFIDVHVHGVAGDDTLDGTDAIASMAAKLPQFGVTAFCPTSVACAPDVLAVMLRAIAGARAETVPGSARVLPAHLESNFISSEFRGAQPVECLRVPPPAGGRAAEPAEPFSGADVLQVIERHAPDVGIVTLAPELDGAIDLIARLVAAGHRVSLGHSGASFAEARAAIAAGARHATHLFNRMSPMTHRAPGLVGAVLASDEVAAEIICDGHHVDPAVIAVAVAAKSPDRIMAITDGTAGSGRPRGSRARLGGRQITVADVALLDDGTFAGSVCTMDQAFRLLAGPVGASLPEAALMCATTPARQLGLQGFGTLTPGAVADLAILTPDLRVVQTWVAGSLAWAAAT